uniref:G126 VD New Superfamily-3 precursor conopeptide n=1 Tax=Conus geographus TaxID=6491 RepID=X5IWU6_CONGE|nr:G126_VD_New_Superfamily-3_precursor_conopeptide [Conus geographus]
MGSMKIYLCLAFLLLLPSTIVDSGLLDKIETIRNWRRDESKCDRCNCAELRSSRCTQAIFCLTPELCTPSISCPTGECRCTKFHQSRCTRFVECVPNKCTDA